MKPNLDALSRTKVCDFCLRDDTCNQLGRYEQMLICKDCNAKAHPSCMNYPQTLADKARSYPWQCIDCKTCSVCQTADDGASILFCDGCDKAYHMKCHEPEVTCKPEGKWMCYCCITEHHQFSNAENGGVNVQTEANGHHSKAFSNGTREHASSTDANGNSTSTFPPIKRELHPIPSSFPDWTADQVADYFKSIGFDEHAHVFVREEIDGKSLLLLKRSDVIEGLSLKLGPAVKLYEKIANLQNEITSKCT